MQSTTRDAFGCDFFSSTWSTFKSIHKLCIIVLSTTTLEIKILKNNTAHLVH